MHVFDGRGSNNGKVIITVAKVCATDRAAATVVALPSPLIDAFIAEAVGTR
jgi:acyl CoA:acetate/3-ketoacid CoA transferase